MTFTKFEMGLQEVVMPDLVYPNRLKIIMATFLNCGKKLMHLFNKKKHVEKRSMARLYPKVAEEILTLVINHKRVSDATIRNF